MASPTLARKGASAYEKGIREGRAMASKSRTPEPEEAEEEEGEEEEEMDGGMKPHSRKRSAKGAKHTTPAKDGYGMKKPMDAEGCSGGSSCMSKGRKGKCDGSCGKKMDSLTPHEYLAACDLGIQNRSRTYIRARLDAATARLDLKCGKGSISEGEKCSKGPAQRVQSKGSSTGNKLKTAAKVVGAAALIGGAAYAATKYGPKALRNAKAAGIKTKRSMKQSFKQAVKEQLKKEGVGPKATPEQWKEWAKSAPKSGSTAAERERFKDFFYKNTPGVRRPKLDSPYAAGFSLDTAALEL